MNVVLLCAAIVLALVASATLAMLWHRGPILKQARRVPAEPADASGAGMPMPAHTGPDPDSGVGAVGGREVAALRQGDVSTLDDVELCRLWRCTYPPLVEPSTSGQLEQLVEIRAALLEELNRRDPAGWRRWVDSGARAGGDPLRYLSSQLRRPRSTPPPG